MSKVFFSLNILKRIGDFCTILFAIKSVSAINWRLHIGITRKW